MTTYSIVGLYTNEQQITWRAVPIGSDGYPSGVGFWLHLNYRYIFHNNLIALVNRIVDSHPEGWCSIAGKNLMLPALILGKDYLAVWKLCDQLDLIASKTSDPTLNHLYTRASESLMRCPVAYDDTNRAFITQDTSPNLYYAEWSYLFNVDRCTLDVFWGDPHTGIKETVYLNADLDEAFWDVLWSELPERA